MTQSLNTRLALAGERRRQRDLARDPAFALRAEPASGLVASRINPARVESVHIAVLNIAGERFVFHSELARKSIANAKREAVRRALKSATERN